MTTVSPPLIAEVAPRAGECVTLCRKPAGECHDCDSARIVAGSLVGFLPRFAVPGPVLHRAQAVAGYKFSQAMHDGEPGAAWVWFRVSSALERGDWS